MYEYRASVVRVIDGDTVDLRVDLGFDASLNMRVRLAGIDAPERGQPGGSEATAWLTQKLPMRADVVLKTQKYRREKYGRYLAEIYLIGDTLSINEQMIRIGHSRVYDGGCRALHLLDPDHCKKSSERYEKTRKADQ